MRFTREFQIDLFRYNRDIQLARDEYAAHPTACATWCIECVQPVGSTRKCETCKARRRMKRLRETRETA